MYRERSHMADVRNVLLNLGLVALIAALILVAAGLASRGARWFWRAVQAGGEVLVVGVVVVGLAFALFFDQAFELFHEIFFAPGHVHVRRPARRSSSSCSRTSSGPRPASPLRRPCWCWR